MTTIRLQAAVLAVFLCVLAACRTVAGRTKDWEDWLEKDRSNARYSSRRQATNNKNRRSEKPNIVLLITDDQDVELGSLNYMPKLQRILAEGGAEFTNAFVTTPMCCPSRSSMLTGMYVHNHNTYTNNDNCSSLAWRQTYETKSFGTYLSNAGYRTGYFGKYLNQYRGNYIPPGWSEWVGLIRNSRFYNYRLNFNGKRVSHGENYHQDYLTDLIANDSVTFLKRSKLYFPNRPVAMVLSVPAPHGPEDAAPQYQHLFENVTTHRTPSWNYAPNPDKQWLLQYTGKMEPIHIAFTDILHRKRLQTLQSVDDAVEKVYQELKNLGEWENTYFIFTSDHGYHLGQYGLVKGKAMPYDFDIRVPFYMTGPNIPRGIRVSNIVLNIDIAPTMLGIAGVETPEHMDGRSILKLFEGITKSGSIVGNTLKKKKAWRDTFLVERGKLSPKKLKGRDRLEAKKNKVVKTKEDRLQEECQKGEYQPPCKYKQQWVCLPNEAGRLRMYKCRRRPTKNNDVTETGCNCRRSKALVNSQEKRLQREFLRQHVNQRELQTLHLRRVGELLLGTVPMPSSNIVKPVTRDCPQKLVSQRRRSLIGADRLKTKFLRDQDKEKRGRRHILTGSSNHDDSEELEAAVTWNIRRQSLNSSYDEPVGNPMPSSIWDGFGEYRKKKKKRGHHRRNRRDASGPGTGELCQVLPNNTIICEQNIHQDLTSWKQQKMSLDDLIKNYRQELDRLKDVRKHLKNIRPITRSEEEGSGEDWDSPELEQPSYNEDDEDYTMSPPSTSFPDSPASPSHSNHPQSSSDNNDIVDLGPDLVDESMLLTNDAIDDAEEEDLHTLIQDETLMHGGHHPNGAHDPVLTNMDIDGVQEEGPYDPDPYRDDPLNPDNEDYDFNNGDDDDEFDLFYNDPDIIDISEETEEGIYDLITELPAEFEGDASILGGSADYTDPEQCNCFEYVADQSRRGRNRNEKSLRSQDSKSFERQQQRELNRQERRQQRKERKRQRQQEKSSSKRNSLDCRSKKMKCFTQTSEHWRHPPYWNSSSSVGSEGKTRRRHDPECHIEGLECSRMDDSHWAVDPKWTLGPFCFCPNCANNTYWCLRNINDSHNFLYCEFITGFISFYDMTVDPYQLENAVHQLNFGVLQQLHNKLDEMKKCRGQRECTVRTRPRREGDLNAERVHRNLYGLSNNEALHASPHNDAEDGSGEISQGLTSGDGSGEIEGMSGDDGDGLSDGSTHLETYNMYAGSGEVDPRKEEYLFLTSNLMLARP